MAAVLRFGAAVWPGIFLGSLGINVWILLGMGLPWRSVLFAALAAAAGNSIEAVLAGYLVARFSEGRDPFLKSREVVDFIFLGATLCTFLAAALGASALCAVRGEWGPFPISFLTWWMGDATGALLVTPLLLAPGRKRPSVARVGRGIEFALFAAATIALWYLCFFSHPSLVVLFIPWTALVSLRMGPARSAAIVFLLAALATGGTLVGASPFILGGLHGSLLLQQGFVACVAVASLLLSSTVSEMGRERRRLQKAHEFQRELFGRSSMGLSLATQEGRHLEVNPAYASLVGRTVEETLSLTTTDLTPEPHWKRDEEQREILKATGRYGPYEKEYLRKDGTRVPVRLSGFSVESRGAPRA